MKSYVLYTISITFFKLNGWYISLLMLALSVQLAIKVWFYIFKDH